MRRDIGANMGDIVSDLGEFRVKFFIFFSLHFLDSFLHCGGRNESMCFDF